MAALNRVVADPAYEAELEERITAARTARLAASMTSPEDSEEAYAHLFPPSNEEERQRRWREHDARMQEQTQVAAGALDEDTYRALFPNG